MAALDRSLISQLPLFQGMTAEEQSEILRSARSSRYAKESAIFEQETEAHSFFVLISGHIRVVRTTPDGQQVIARYISEGEIFGVAAALGRTTYPASALAAVDCVVLTWPNALWAEMARRFPAFGATTYRTVGTRLQETQTRVVEMSTEQVEQRIAHALLR
ncbi:Crp/Fnr family transcriptional regulator, partial [Mesorhizobium sp. M8A.F.Ca.ET.023.02.2.1]